MPEVSLVAILDADKEGYLRSATSLIQSMGRCARHLEGRAILYADNMTDSMRQAIGETSRRRAKQEAYNREHNITPQSIVKSVDMQLARIVEADYLTIPLDDAVIGDFSEEAQLTQVIAQLEAQMREAAKNFEFERAAALRDRIRALKQRDLGAIFASAGTDSQAAAPVEVSTSEASAGPTDGVDDTGRDGELPVSVAPTTEQPSGAAAQPPAKKGHAQPRSPENPDRTCSAGVPPALRSCGVTLNRGDALCVHNSANSFLPDGFPEY